MMDVYFSLMSSFDYQDKNLLDYFRASCLHLCIFAEERVPSEESEDRIGIPTPLPSS